MKKIIIGIACSLLLAACGGNAQQGATEGDQGHAAHGQPATSEGEGHDAGGHDHGTEGHQPEATNNPELDQLADEVQALHDEVMAHAGKLMSYKRKAISTAETIDGEKSAQLSVLANQLDDAHDSMMKWMRAYGEGSRSEMSDDDRKLFLETKKTEMEEIKSKTEAALDQAKKHLPEAI